MNIQLAVACLFLICLCGSLQTVSGKYEDLVIDCLNKTSFTIVNKPNRNFINEGGKSFRGKSNGSAKHHTLYSCIRKVSADLSSTNTTARGFNFAMPFVDLSGTTWCPYTSLTNTTCNSTYKYQTYDGQCNNLQNLYYGRSDMPFIRYNGLTPAYGDAKSTPRNTSVLGGFLPNVRTISLGISTPTTAQRLEPQIAHLLSVFGQFLAHDITGTAAITGSHHDAFYCLKQNKNRE